MTNSKIEDSGKSYEVIPAPDTLRKHVKGGKPAAIDFTAVKAAEKALQDLSKDFDNWMGDEIKNLIENRDKMMRDGITRDAIGVLFQAAHDIRGQAATLGYPRAGAAAKSLCELLEADFDITDTPLDVIDSHVDAVRALFKEHDRPDSERVADVLIEALRRMTEEFLTKHGQKAEDGEKPG